MALEDVPQIAELEKICFSDPWSEQSIVSELENPLSLWLVACENNVIAGYVGSQSVMGWADMMNLAVHPDYRRRGVGEALVSALESGLSGNGVSVLTLEVRQSNENAIALYKKMGFEQVGVRPGYYRHPKENALILRKEWKL